MVIKFQYLKSIFPGVVLALIFCLFSQGINNVLAIEIFGMDLMIKNLYLHHHFYQNSNYQKSGYQPLFWRQ